MAGADGDKRGAAAIGARNAEGAVDSIGLERGTFVIDGRLGETRG